MRFPSRIYLEVIQHISLWLGIICFAFFLVELFPFTSAEPETILAEEFEPALVRLDNLEKVTGYCDSIVSIRLRAFPCANKDSLITNIATSLIRKRFYHRQAEYGVGFNFMALFLQPVMVNKTVVSIVDIDAILKRPYGLCGQQARVLAAILTGKGIPARKILFFHHKYGGHYALEVYYKNDWHFFDPNKEPDLLLADKHHRPSLKKLQRSSSLLKEFYGKNYSKMFESLFITGKAYPFDAVEGPNLLLFQQVTHILSFCSWVIFFVVFLWVKKKNLRRPYVKL